MSGLLTNKTAAITGGATGIGRAIALEYLRQGARGVAINHYPDTASEEQFKTMLEEAAQFGGELIAVPGDIADEETGGKFVGEVVRRFGRLDVFVSNAGVCQFEEFLR